MTRPTVLVTSAAFLVLALDLATKAAAAGGTLRGPWVDATVNGALALGIADGPASWETALAIAGLSAAAVVLRRVVRRRPEPLVAIACGLVLGGTGGNLVDRLSGAGVRDFLVGPAILFNVADVALVLGVVALLAAGVSGSRRRPALDAR